MDVNKYGHSAAVMLGSAPGRNVATWMNIIEVIHEDEDCFFLLPDGKVVTGPEWCEHVGVPEQQQQKWQQLISVRKSNGVIAKGMTISQVLGSTSLSPAQCHVSDAAPATGKERDIASRQHTHATATQLETDEHLGTHSIEADIIKAEPAIDAADVQHGNGAAVRVCQAVQQTHQPATLTEDTQLQDTSAQTIRNIATRGDPPETTTAKGRVSDTSQLVREADDVGRRQHGDSQRAVRITITNYNTHKTVYALWTNADSVLRQHQVGTPPGVLFLPCMDETYQPALGATPVNAAGLVRLASMVRAGGVYYQTRLNQRFRAATGHCFYPGMSLAQVMCVVSSARTDNRMCFGQDWDETAMESVVCYTMHQKLRVPVMALSTITVRAAYGEAQLTVVPGQSEDVMVHVCDSQYNKKQPKQKSSIKQFLKLAGYGPSHIKAVFSIQGVQLPSGYILPPGTSFPKIIEELRKLDSQADGGGGAVAAPGGGSSVAPHVPSQLPTEVNDVGRRQHGSNQAVRVTITNYAKHKTVYALWTNADDAIQQHQTPSLAAGLFLPCTDGSYQPAMDAAYLDAPGLVKLTSMAYTSSARYQIRLNQRFRAATGHCFYPGMSLAQVMSVMSSGRDTSHLMFGADWDEAAIAPVVVWGTAEQACVRVMAFHSRTMCTVYGKVQLNVPPDRKEDTMLFICDSNYDVRKPGQLVTLSHFLQEAGYSPYQSPNDQCTVVFTTQGLHLPSGNILMPGTSLQQVFEALDDMKSDSEDEDDDDALRHYTGGCMHTRRQSKPKFMVVGSQVTAEVNKLNRHINPAAADAPTSANTQQQATQNLICAGKHQPTTESGSQNGSPHGAPAVPDTLVQNTQRGASTDVRVERQRTEEVICLISDDESDGDVEMTAAADGEVVAVMNNTAASKQQSEALITKSGSPKTQHADAGAGNNVLGVISNSSNKQQDGPVIHKQQVVPTNTGNGCKKRPASSLEPQADKLPRQKVRRDSSVTEQVESDSCKQQGLKRHQENEGCCDVATKKRNVTADVQPLLPPVVNRTNIATADIIVGSGEPANAASTAVVQTPSPAPDLVQQHPTAEVHIQHQVPANKPPPTLPVLNIKDNSVHPLNVVAAWRTICSLLRYLGCSNDAVKKLLVDKTAMG